MAQYIPKAALVAEIDRRVYEDYNTDEEIDEVAVAVLASLKYYICTFETERVDLDKERRKYLTKHFNVYEDGILQSKRSGMPLDTFDVIQIAKHFYELGLKQKGE